MGETARALGHGSTLNFKGQAYTVAPLDFDALAYFERWLEDRAWDAAERRCRKATEAEARDIRQGVSESIAAGAFSQGSPAFVRASQSLPGQKRLLLLMLQKGRGQNGRDVSEELVEEIFADALEQAIAAMNRAEGTDPNSKNPPADGGAATTTPSLKSAPFSAESLSVTGPGKSAD